MNRKIIKSILKSKINKWLASIDDPKVQALAKKNTIVTGGAIASMLLNEDVKDFDIYFKDKETTLAIAEYYVKKFNERKGNFINKVGVKTTAYVLDGARLDEIEKRYGTTDGRAGHLINMTPDRVKIVVRSDGVAAENPEVLKEPFADVYDALERVDAVPADEVEKQDEGKTAFRPIFLSSNAITLSDKVQLVLRFYGEPEEIHKNYDFIHCTNYWTSNDSNLVLNPRALEALLAKELLYQGSKYPLCSMIRTRKFIKRGWHINAGQYLKMGFQLSQLDLTDINVLEDQTTGVDSAYFNVLITALQEKMTKDPSFRVDNSYVASILDKIF